jgi:hypothetical protein
MSLGINFSICLVTIFNLAYCPVSTAYSVGEFWKKQHSNNSPDAMYNRISGAALPPALIGDAGKICSVKCSVQRKLRRVKNSVNYWVLACDCSAGNYFFVLFNLHLVSTAQVIGEFWNNW